MNTRKSSAARRLPAVLAVAGFIASCALSANAQTLNFTQRAGFYSGSAASGIVDPATVVKGLGGASQAGFGGLDFYIDAGATPNPGQTWRAVEWGCVRFDNTPCANGGSNVTPWATHASGFIPNQVDVRSSLEVIGCPNGADCLSGTLDTTNWTPVTRVLHHNWTIGSESNVLDSVDISSSLRIGNPTPFFPVDGAGSVTSVFFDETPNDAQPCAHLPGAPASPLTGGASPCDDFALVSGLDLSSLFIPANAVGNPTPLQINFQLAPTSPGALVCGQQAPANPLCAPYNGTDLLIYTKEAGENSFEIQARLSPVITVALFVIGDCHWDQSKPKSSPGAGETNLRALGEIVNFWGSQWWKNNCMSVFTSNGYPAFKGYATNSVVDSDGNPNCGQWQARPGNSGNPPDTIPDIVNIIVTDNVIKQGPNIGGNIKQIVQVQRSLSNNDNYAGNPGHQGWGKITQILCTKTTT